MRTIWILPGWFGFIFGSSPSGSTIAVLPAMARQAAVMAVKTVCTWNDRWHQRIDLKSLPDYRLRDIGIEPMEARREAAKPFWHR